MIKAPSFSIRTVKGYPFTVSFSNASQQFFKKSDDYAISFTVKQGEDLSKAKAVTKANADYHNTNIFKNAKDADNLMKIFLPRSKNYYEDKVFVVEAAVKRTVDQAMEHQFTVAGQDRLGNANKQIKAGELLLKIINKFPTIKVTGGDGTNLYSETNKTFDLNNSTNIQIFSPQDTDNDPLTNTYKWILYKNGQEVTGAWIHPAATSTGDHPFSDLNSYNEPSIRPAGVMINKTTTLASQSDIDSYILKGYAKIDDGLGGIAEKTVEFNFKK